VNHPPFTAWEFFAGGGMARLGLASAFRTTFANDFDAGKASAYRANFGDEHLSTADIHTLRTADLPGHANLAWASSPCQDFSLAGARAGLAGGRSSALLGFLRLVGELGREGRAPGLLVIENVSGLLSARAGADFAALQNALSGLGYRTSPSPWTPRPFFRSRARASSSWRAGSAPFPSCRDRPREACSSWTSSTPTRPGILRSGPRGSWPCSIQPTRPG
jgi:DNA (cytosine-5)-methyltransferase 1